MPQHRLFSFGVFELVGNTGELRKEGKAQPRLQAQPLQILLMLLERPREIVTRDKIREKLWASDTFVDFDHGLNTAINKLRNALDDSASNPRFIQTLPRQGYRFIVPVEVAGIGIGSNSMPAQQRVEPDARVVKGGEKLDHWGGVRLDQMSVWKVGLGREGGVWSGGLRSGLWIAFRPERKTPPSTRDGVVI